MSIRAVGLLPLILLGVLVSACDDGGDSPTAPARLDSLSIATAQPPSGSELPANRSNPISVTLSYQFATARGGRVAFALTCQSGSQLSCVQAGVVAQLSQATGSVSFSTSLTPPANADIRYRFELVPDGAAVPAASATLAYRSSS